MLCLSRIFRTLSASFTAVWICSACQSPSDKEEIIVAVATNFITTAEELKTAFEAKSDYHVTLVSGSTGNLYAQIKSGAPYDVFLAADQERPRLLGETSFTYAIGQLVFYGQDQPSDETRLKTGNFKHLAIANPDLAPYGQAAIETLTSMGLQNTYADKLVLGENVGQALAMVHTGNAEYGLVARSSVPKDNANVWLVPQHNYNPIRQDAVLIQKKTGAKNFISFLKSEMAQEVISANGYLLP